MGDNKNDRCWKLSVPLADGLLLDLGLIQPVVLHQWWGLPLDDACGAQSGSSTTLDPVVSWYLSCPLNFTNILVRRVSHHRGRLHSPPATRCFSCNSNNEMVLRFRLSLYFASMELLYVLWSGWHNNTVLSSLSTFKHKHSNSRVSEVELVCRSYNDFDCIEERN